MDSRPLSVQLVPQPSTCEFAKFVKAWSAAAGERDGGDESADGGYHAICSCCAAVGAGSETEETNLRTVLSC